MSFAYPAGNDWHSVGKHWRLSGSEGEVVVSDLKDGKLVALMQDYQQPCRPMNLMYTQDRYRLPKLRRFVDFAMQMWASTSRLNTP